jgi:tRNA(adenine34) deaminase
MCVGALLNARIKKIVFGAFDKKSGACVSVFKIANSKKLNHKIEITGGRYEHLSMACSYIVRAFFENIRFQKNQYKKNKIY